MRTKLLLTAAAMIAGVVSSQAQSNVYSVNIVGYVNTPLVGAGKYTLVANPLDNGTNTLASLLDATLPNKSSVLGWDVNAGSYILASKSAGVWTPNLSMPPGVGFFVQTPLASGPLTNTFIGSVVIGPGGSATNAVPAVTALMGSLVPYAGDMADTNLNLGPTLPNKSSILIWDKNAQGFILSSKSSGTWTPNVSLGVGDGFFSQSKSATNWTQTLPAN